MSGVGTAQPLARLGLQSLKKPKEQKNETCLSGRLLPLVSLLPRFNQPILT